MKPSIMMKNKSFLNKDNLIWLETNENNKLFNVPKRSFLPLTGKMSDFVKTIKKFIQERIKYYWKSLLYACPMIFLVSRYGPIHDPSYKLFMVGNYVQVMAYAEMIRITIELFFQKPNELNDFNIIEQKKTNFMNRIYQILEAGIIVWPLATSFDYFYDIFLQFGKQILYKK